MKIFFNKFWMYLLFVSSLGTIIGCKPQNMQTEYQRVQRLSMKIHMADFTFTPTQLNNKSLSNGYSLTVSDFSIQSYLPYMGTGDIQSVINSKDIGLNFLSKKFDYNVDITENGWRVSIYTYDTPRKTILTFDISESGYTYLLVRERDREAVLFYGNIKQ